MWSLDPNIRDFVSEAREYAYDWNVPGGVPGSGGALPPADEIRKLAEQIVGGHGPWETGAAEPEGDVVRARAEQHFTTGCRSAGLEPEPTGRLRSGPAGPRRKRSRRHRGAVMAEAPQPVAVSPGETNAGAASPRRRHGGAKPC